MKKTLEGALESPPPVGRGSTIPPLIWPLAKPEVAMLLRSPAEIRSFTRQMVKMARNERALFAIQQTDQQQTARSRENIFAAASNPGRISGQMV